MSGKNIYSSNNYILTGSSIPTEGTYKVGDIIVNNGANAAEEPMWMCIEAGTPGIWKVIGKVEDIDLSGLMTESKDLVGAINELFQSANNGKELIANAIGEPLSSEDTFQAMSDDIDGLLATFKANMMNNGVAIEANDRFKALIDKIASLADNEGKGIQYAEGVVSLSSDIAISDIQFNYSIEFTPTLLFVVIPYVSIGLTSRKTYKAIISNLYGTQFPDATVSTIATLSINNVSNTSFTITKSGDSTVKLGSGSINWYAIGVGEEDTTLRDSLANILQDEGVEVTEEDDMASLITKTDEEFDRKNAEINSKNSTITNLNSSISSKDSTINSLNNTIKNKDTEISNLNTTINANKNILVEKLTAAGYDIYSTDTMDMLLDFLDMSTVHASDIKQIACGQSHTFILKTDGSLWACGYNYYGQLGLGNTKDVTSFTKVTTNINNDVKEIACGCSHTVIIKNDGSVWACGYNYDGQLGLNNTTDQKTFTKVSTNISNDASEVHCTGYATFIIKTNGTLWSCGSGTYGQNALGSTSDQKTFKQVTTNVTAGTIKQLACGGDFVMMVKTDGSLWACGGTYHGQLGLGVHGTTSSDYKTTFTKVTTNVNNDVKEVYCGDQHTIIIKNNGTIYACGDNAECELGIEDLDLFFTTFVKTDDPNLNNVKQMICCEDITYILKNDGTVWVCGDDEFGQSGRGTTAGYTGSFVQITTNTDNVKQLFRTHGSFVFMLKNDNTIWACGHNDRGQLGVGNTTNQKTFKRIARRF